MGGGQRRTFAPMRDDFPSHGVILGLAVPNIVANVTVPLLGMADIAIAGRVGGDTAIGAIALGTSIFNFIYFNFSFLRMGASGLTAQAFGAGDRRECGAVLARAVATAVVLAGALLLFQRPVIAAALRLMGGDAAVSALARRYLSVRIWAAPAAVASFALHGWYTGMQDARTPMWVAVFLNAVNVAASAALALGAGMGLAGVALGTVVAQYSALLLSLALLRARYGGVVRGVDWRASLRPGRMARFLAVNRDIFLRSLCVVTAYTVFTAASSRHGATVLAANTLLLQLFTFFSYMSDGFAYAAESLSGRLVGARDQAGLRRAARRLAAWAGGVAALFTAAYVVAGQPFLALFGPSEAVLSVAASRLGWIAAIPALSFIPFMIDGIMIGATRTRALRDTSAMATAAYLATLWLATPRMADEAIWLAFSLFLALRGALLAPHLARLLRDGVGQKG